MNENFSKINIIKYSHGRSQFFPVLEKLSELTPKQRLSLINLFTIYFFNTVFHHSTNILFDFPSCCCMYNWMNSGVMYSVVIERFLQDDLNSQESERMTKI